jgi:chemotaxis protein histidine kinase CheA
VIAAFVRRLNDAMPNDDIRTSLLLPLVPRLIGTRSTPEIELRRGYLAADFAARAAAPAALRAAGLDEEAQTLELLPEVVDHTATEAASAAAKAATSAAERVTDWATAKVTAKATAKATDWAASKATAKATDWATAKATTSAADRAAASAAAKAATSAAYWAAEAAYWATAKATAAAAISAGIYESTIQLIERMIAVGELK